MSDERRLYEAPAEFPGARTARPMRLDLLGKFAPHPSAQPPDQDAYSLFYDRSGAMGWLTDAFGRGPTALWGMNEAETAPDRCWFQVDVTSDSSLLPLLPMCACAGAVVYRLGTFRLDAVELQIPEPVGPQPSPVPVGLLEAAGWFGNCAPSDRGAIEVVIGGVDLSVIAGWMRPWTQNVFVCDSAAATLRGTVVEWSLDALAWTAAFLAYGCHATGVDVPLAMKLTPTT